MVKILLSQGIEAVIKWVDNFIFICYPTGHHTQGGYVYAYNTKLVWDIAEELGWPWVPAKFVDFSLEFTYIGFCWNLHAKSMELPEKKKTKYLEWISSWTVGSHTAKDTEKVIGTLNHVCLVVLEGRSRLISLYKFRRGFKTNHAKGASHKLSSGTADDIGWWRSRLLDEFVRLRIIRPPEPLDTKLFIDTSTGWGIGLILDGKWLAWQLTDDWNSGG
jgi:hypothetical protein